jgi:hypothetical protein
MRGDHVERNPTAFLVAARPLMPGTDIDDDIAGLAFDLTVVENERAFAATALCRHWRA